VRSALTAELGAGLPTHFSLLAALARAPNLEWRDVVRWSGVEESAASRYVRILEESGIVEAANPALAAHSARRRRYRIADRFTRFWFGFVFPHQAELAAGLRPDEHYDRSVAPFLGPYVADAFEEICRDWLRERHRDLAEAVAPWWGLARRDLRRRGAGSSEEIGALGTRDREVTVAADCHWQSRPVGLEVLRGLLERKLPALHEAGAEGRRTEDRPLLQERLRARPGRRGLGPR